ncbi:MAG: hypothetical protein K5872_16310 [Rhizobiaceae bacterium]|nr:hypothetical protein [Rhizobiaceae bacterium]MCV0407785.1 hypothetical protein [Rhizobiaceae bacterium]
MPGDRLPRSALEEALGRVLASEEFARSERSRAMLRHIVEADLDGRAGDLKGFSIAVDVFGRDSDFDPAHDPVVRVQAGRLRELLKAYYAGSGRNDPVRISIPLGHYIPAYASHGTPERRAGAAVERAALTFRSWMPSRLLAAGLAGIILLAGGAAYLTLPRAGAIASADLSTSPGGAGSLDRTRLLPLVSVRNLAGADGDAVEILLCTGLSGFDTVELISEDGDGDNVEADFTLAVAPGPSADKLTLRLTDARDSRVLVSRLIDDRNDIESSVSDMLTGIAPVSGVIYARLRETGRETPLTHCLFLNHAYYADQTGDRHRKAYRCHEDLVRKGIHSSLIYSELAGLHLEAVTDSHPYPPRASLDEAVELARRAVSFGPLSPYAHRASGFVLSRAGSSEEALRWMKKAHRLNPFDLSMAASYGYSLVWAGRYADGAKVLRRAVASSSTRPTWWDYTLFLADFMEGQMDQAAASTDALAATRQSHYLAAQLLTARHVGDERRASELRNEIVRAFPSFATDPRQHFVRAQYPHELTDRLVQALQAAGLGRS